MTQEEILQELEDMCAAKKRRPFQDENKTRTRQLGILLYEMGGDDGHELMCNTRDHLPEHGQKDLEYVWRNIGEWSD